MAKVLTLSATEFKAKCLALLDQVAGEGLVVHVTKRGKVVAELSSPVLGAAPGFAVGLIQLTGDVVSPTGEAWDALEDGAERQVAERRRGYRAKG